MRSVAFLRRYLVDWMNEWIGTCKLCKVKDQSNSYGLLKMHFGIFKFFHFSLFNVNFLTDNFFDLTKRTLIPAIACSWG